jgi:hypothetical protein
VEWLQLAEREKKKKVPIIDTCVKADNYDIEEEKCALKS